MKKIKALSFSNKGRVIVISDIHGELKLLKRLLEKVNYDTEDYLIINGDLCEKGSNSKGVVSYLMELSANNPKVHVTEGNCEALIEELLNENPKLINYLCARKNSLLNEWLELLGFHVNEKTNIQEVKELLINNFPEEIKWLSELPTAIETDDYIFVHAGLENIENWKETDRKTAITLPSFLDKSHCANKYVIVGHWPLINYSSNIPANNPIIDKAKKIIAIDGGNAVKATGQLNAFIINRASSSPDVFSYTYVDNFPNFKVLKDFSAEPKMQGSITYPLYNIAPVEKNDHFTLCKLLKSNQSLYVKNEYILQNETGHFTAKTDVSCAQITVRKGDIVSLIDDTCKGYDLIKKDGLEGWIVKDIILELSEKEGKINVI
ncbi:metallophosphoesterase [Sutcliffiella rhizosphaerae]|uniref:Bis(5'-nucleosyl)-tetraphosphatase, symmetrical n=1 Tax=Sutcliffiella rhizosphaerae TaxID=2880967 RepID=A0ABN8AFY3_9BACI|nr:metallophosphoesterase [Sutcliffiella rhizosphaerae]CAG9623027.1 Bis(5'-nucleosyl)-tetraphosphatase, symmetrical [Sutcliffiella rhizosphaerae]